jgi:hypothetical protein
MSNQKIEKNNNKQIKNIKEKADRTEDQQNQQVANTTRATTSNISETTNEFTNTIDKYQQQTNKEILEKSIIDTANQYQRQAINTIQTIVNNYVELQNNILDTYKSVFSKFIDNTYNNNNNNKSNWNNL